MNKCIPLQMINLVKEQINYSTITPRMSDLMIENLNFTDKKMFQQIFEELFNTTLFSRTSKEILYI